MVPSILMMMMMSDEAMTVGASRELKGEKSVWGSTRRTDGHLLFGYRGWLGMTAGVLWASGRTHLLGGFPVSIYLCFLAESWKRRALLNSVEQYQSVPMRIFTNTTAVLNLMSTSNLRSPSTIVHCI